ncbi:MAG: RICIN domain-containing protein [Clostridia bacterium]|nr:RICIN domain-containing protein [Clostridia bacterium]
MKKNVSIRMFCMLLAVLLLFSILPLTVVAVDDVALPEVALPTEENVILPSDPAIAEESLLNPDELTLEQLQTATLAVSDVPEVLPYSVAQEKQLVNRVRSKETLSSLVFQGRNGGKTAYIYDTPIKYIADDGSIRDKSTALVAGKYALLGKTYAYAVLENSIKQYYPATINNGILLQMNGHNVQITPFSNYVSPIITQATVEGSSILYRNVFGQNINLKYTSVLSGVKEDIILQSYTGVNSFSFTMNTGGLFVVEQEGKYVLAGEDGTAYASLGDVLVYDSNGAISMGTMTVATVTAGASYRITLTVDAAFLRSSDTVYPVTVDPTIQEEYIYDEYSEGVEGIVDYGLYSTETMPAYADNYHLLGYQNGIGYGRIIYKFPIFIKPQCCCSKLLCCDKDENCCTTGSTCCNDLQCCSGENSCCNDVASCCSDEESCCCGKSPSCRDESHCLYAPKLLWDLSGYAIASAVLYIHGDGLSDTTASVWPIEYSWTAGESNAFTDDFLWDNTCISSDPPDYVALTDRVNHTAFDITEIVKGWGNYNEGQLYAYNPEYGLIIANENAWSDSYRWLFETVENASYNVYLEVDYDDTRVGGEVYINSNANGQYLQLTTVASNTYALSTNVYDVAKNYYWFLEYVGDGKYIIVSSNGNRSLYVNDSNQIEIKGKPYAPTDNYLWTCSNAILQNGRLFKNVASGRYLCCSGTTISVVPAKSYTASDYTTVVWRSISRYEHRTIQDFSLDDRRFDVGTTTALPMVYDVEEPDFIDPRYYFDYELDKATFSINAAGQLTTPAQNASAELTITHKPTGIEKTFYIEASALLSGVYRLQNVQSQLILDVEDDAATDNAQVCQDNAGIEATQRWNIQLQSDGTYIIQPVQNENMYLRITGDTASPLEIVVGSYNWSYIRWYIDKTASGNLKISPTSNSSLTIGLEEASTGTGVKAVLVTYANDADYTDEWGVGEYTAAFYGIPDYQNPGHIHDGYIEKIGDDPHWQTITGTTQSTTAAQCIQDLKNSEIFAIRCHGANLADTDGNLVSTFIQLNSQESSILYSHTNAAATVNDYVITSEDDFSNVKLALFIGCLTGYGGKGGKNLPSVVVAQGAEVAIGFAVEIECNRANVWTDTFFAQLLTGATVKSAVFAANQAAGGNFTDKNVIICGNENFRLT